MVPLENVLAADDYLQNNNTKSNNHCFSLAVRDKDCFAKYLKAEDAECGWPRIFYINYSDRNDNVYDRYLESSTK